MTREESLELKLRENKKPESTLVIKEGKVYLLNTKKCLLLSTKEEKIDEISEKYGIPKGEFVDRETRKEQVVVDKTLDKSIFGVYNNTNFIMCTFGAVTLGKDSVKGLWNNQIIQNKKVIEVRQKYTQCSKDCMELIRTYPKELRRKLYLEVIKLADLETAESIRGI